MPTATKRAPTAVKRTPAKAAAATSKPYMRFHHSQALRDQTLQVLAAVEGAERASAHAGQLAELVMTLTDSGLDQYFVQSLKATKAGFVVQQSAVLGMAGVQKVMGTVVRNVLGRMDDRQLLSVCASIRQFMV